MSWGNTFRWTVSIAAVVATLAALWFVMIQFADPVSQRNADRIQEGMTPEQVFAVMGRKADRREDFTVRQEVWCHKSRPDTLVVWFLNERVLRVSYRETARSVWDRFVRWIGW